MDSRPLPKDHLQGDLVGRTRDKARSFRDRAKTLREAVNKLQPSKVISTRTLAGETPSAGGGSSGSDPNNVTDRQQGGPNDY
jgi:hypothetical protein